MKKFWKKLSLLLCLTAVFGFVFTACGGDDDDETPTNGGGSGDGTETEKLAAGGNYETLADGTSAGRKSVTAPGSAGTITLKVGDTSTTYETIAAALSAAAASTGDCVRCQIRS